MNARQVNDQFGRSSVGRFVIAPKDFGKIGEGGDELIKNVVRSLTGRASDQHHAGRQAKGTHATPGVKVVERHAEGVQVMEMSGQVARALDEIEPDVVVAPLVTYSHPPDSLSLGLHPFDDARKRGRTKLKLTFCSEEDGSPIRGAEVCVVDRASKRGGAVGVTDDKGRVTLPTGKAVINAQSLHLVSSAGHLGAFRTGRIECNQRIAVRPIGRGPKDALRHYYGDGDLHAGHQVVVGVVDSGSGPHQDLVFSGGKNTVFGESPADWTDNGTHHGTHVAGIIAGRGTGEPGLRGVAPSVGLYSYRVFGKGRKYGFNADIIPAITQAVRDKCDLINLSLGSPADDILLERAIDYARANGSLVIVAAGNGGCVPPTHPARYPGAVAVSAFGRFGTYPPGSSAEAYVTKQLCRAGEHFVAKFTCYGPQIAFTGPGVGILSTVPGGYAMYSGTSMAAPAVTGVASRLLSERPDILAMDRNAARSEAILQLLRDNASRLDFPLAEYEGNGVVRPRAMT